MRSCMCDLIDLIARDGHNLSLESGHNFWRKVNRSISSPVDLGVHSLDLSIDVEMVHLSGYI